MFFVLPPLLLVDDYSFVDSTLVTVSDAFFHTALMKICKTNQHTLLTDYVTVFSLVISVTRNLSFFNPEPINNLLGLGGCIDRVVSVPLAQR